MAMDDGLPLPPALLYVLAALLGVIIAVGSLSYAPEGRINVFTVWFLWAGLPLLGAVVATLGAMTGGRRPWLFRLGRHSLSWFPDRQQRWRMLFLLQWLWCLVALGMLVGYGALLLFTDLAFGWSTTVLAGETLVQQLAQVLSTPWRWFWPAAVPDADLIEQTRYLRIAPESTPADRAGDWWPFLLASLLFYNLFPRLLLTALVYGRWRLLLRPQMQVRAPDAERADGSTGADASGLNRADARQWCTSGCLIVNWEARQPAAPLMLGLQGWQSDVEALEAALVRQPMPQRLLWRVPAERSPVAELADLIRLVQTRSRAEQGLLLLGEVTTIQARHWLSWQSFARREGLVWVEGET